MKRLLAIFLALVALAAKSQLGWEDFYSERDFRAILQQAKTPAEKIYALGFLGKKGLSKDSIMREIYSVSAKTNDKKLQALALWWDGQIHDDDTTRMNKLLQFAIEQQLTTFQIAAHLLLADYYNHQSSQVSLFYGKGAESLLEKLQGTAKEIDSFKIDIFRRIAHAYVHSGDAINTAKYLLSLRGYAERDKDERIKMQAVEVLDDMYSESGDKKKSLPWILMLHEFFKRTNQVQKYAGQTFDLAVIYSQLYVSDSTPEYKTKATYYFKVLDNLIDSLNLRGPFLYWVLQDKFDLGILTAKEVIDLLDNDYNSRNHFTWQQKRNLKLQVYLSINQFDSLEAHIATIPKSEFKSFWLKNYYMKKGDFLKAIPILKELRDSAEKWHDFGLLQWAYPDLVKSYVGINEYKLAYESKLKSLQIKDTIDRRESKEQVASMETQKQIELQKAAFDDEQATAALQNRIRIYGFAAGLAALLTLALILWKNNQRKQRDKLKIEQAYNELKSTQQQLIQSEKMASLGELTAGIAHEIQNPLNFVNNFSEVNKELVDDLKLELAVIPNEGKQGNIQSESLRKANEIADTIKNNEDKINQHGKRADAIVKGMLQHSRITTGQKELTDINALTDEYLRLAYHGIRANEKNFNAKIKTNFDPAAGKINVVPQEIGRVILNLVNNAFYAVNEKQKTITNVTALQFEPAITISTRKINTRPDDPHVNNSVQQAVAHGKIEIRVKDNGNGIPEKYIDKIFQPFFTTKPAGQGTGLGLSLAYDIITKSHGGKISVATNEGIGSEFVIELPLS